MTVAGKLPFDDHHLPRLFQKISAAKYELPENLSGDLKHLLKRLMSPDPKKRITIPEARRHPWVAKGKTVSEDYP